MAGYTLTKIEDVEKILDTVNKCLETLENEKKRGISEIYGGSTFEPNPKLRKIDETTTTIVDENGKEKEIVKKTIGIASAKGKRKPMRKTSTPLDEKECTNILQEIHRISQVKDTKIGIDSNTIKNIRNGKIEEQNIFLNETLIPIEVFSLIVLPSRKKLSDFSNACFSPRKLALYSKAFKNLMDIIKNEKLKGMIKMAGKYLETK